MNQSTRQIPEPKADEALMLADVLARTDVLFAPSRTCSKELQSLPRSARAAIAERQSRFSILGVPMDGSAATQNRMGRSRLVQKLRDQNLVQVNGRGTRAAGMRLTARGDELARTMCSLPTLADSWGWLARMQSLVQLGLCWNGMVPEVYLTESHYDQRDWGPRTDAMEMGMLPLQSAGLVSCQLDTLARAWWSLTPSGEAALLGPPPERTPNLHYSYEAHGQYEDQYPAYLADRQRWEGCPGYVVIPLSAGIWPGMFAERVKELTPAQRAALEAQPVPVVAI